MGDDTTQLPEVKRKPPRARVSKELDERCLLTFTLQRGASNLWPEETDERGRAIAANPLAWARARVASFLVPSEAEEVAGLAAKQTLAALEKGDFGALGALVDPEHGVCLRASFARGCKWKTAAEISSCGTSTQAELWALDLGSEDPSDSTFTCREALTKIFYEPPMSKVTAPTFNCFPQNQGRSNCGGGYVDVTVEADVYVEYHVPDPDYPEGGLGWRSLWMTFRETADDGVVLTSLMSEYWGI